MNACEEFIESLERLLPDMCTTEDLVTHGIYPTRQAAARARKTGNGPQFLPVTKKNIVYPKPCVISFLKECQCKVPQNSNTSGPSLAQKIKKLSCHLNSNLHQPIQN